MGAAAQHAPELPQGSVQDAQAQGELARAVRTALVLLEALLEDGPCSLEHRDGLAIGGRDAHDDDGEVSPADLSPELSKHFRALRMWLPLVLLGVAPFRAALEEKLLLARYFHRQISRAGFEAGPAPELSIVTYRWAPPGVALEQANRMNKAIMEGAYRDGRVFLSSTMLEGRFTLRMAALAFRTHRRTIDLAVQVLREQAAALAVVA